MLQAKIIMNGTEINTIKDDSLDPLLYAVAGWCDQVVYVGNDEKLVIEVTKSKEE